MKLYYHKTDGGAEYLTDTFIRVSFAGKGRRHGKAHYEGVINDKTRYVVRIDGDITKDAELTDRENKERPDAYAKEKKALIRQARAWIEKSSGSNYGADGGVDPEAYEIINRLINLYG